MTKQESKEKGVNITISERSTERVIDALLDAFSPITHGLGSLGDRIRVYRAVTLIKTLKRAKEIAHDNGYRLELPPPKFLIPYLEAASLEEECDADLQEKWARLLANAGAKPDSLSYYARAVLSELSAEEASLLDRLVQDCCVLKYDNSGAYLKDIGVKLKKAADAIDESVRRLESGELTGERAHRLMINAFEGVTALEVVGFAINTKSDAFQKPHGYASFSSPRFGDEYERILILEGRRIIDAGDFHPPNVLTSNVLSIRHVSFTKLGFGVVRKLYKHERKKPPVVN